MKEMFQVGDRVAYSAAFLRSTGQHTGDIPFARGVVVGLRPLGERTLVEVDWGGTDVPSRVIDANLCKVGSREFSAN